MFGCRKKAILPVSRLGKSANVPLRISASKKKNCFEQVVFLSCCRRHFSIFIASTMRKSRWKASGDLPAIIRLCIMPFSASRATTTSASLQRVSCNFCSSQNKEEAIKVSMTFHFPVWTATALPHVSRHVSYSQRWLTSPFLHSPRSTLARKRNMVLRRICSHSPCSVCFAIFFSVQRDCVDTYQYVYGSRLIWYFMHAAENCEED